MKFAKIILILLPFLLLARPVFAQQDILIPTTQITPTPSIASQTLTYDLPYPGLLPGNPLYTLKAIRDKIDEILISDPSKKTEFYLLQADKRLAASLVLFNMGKATLGETTLSKSQNYLEDSINEVIRAQKSQENENDILAKIKRSSEKQIIEIKMLIKQNKGETGQRLEGDLKRAQDLQNRANQINPQK